jgi:hypothetical protein
MRLKPGKILTKRELQDIEDEIDAINLTADRENELSEEAEIRLEYLRSLVESSLKAKQMRERRKRIEQSGLRLIIGGAA